jgi:hypothetical protein
MNEKDWSDPQPDSAIQPKARGLLHMEREYFAHHIWSRFRGLSTSQARSNRKYLEDYSTYLKEGPEATRRMFWLLEVLEDAQPSTRRLQDSATKSSGATPSSIFLCATHTLADLFCAQPALLPTFLSATRTLVECFLSAAHLFVTLPTSSLFSLSPLNGC